jgi:hypothetical protein
LRYHASIVHLFCCRDPLFLHRGSSIPISLECQFSLSLSYTSFRKYSFLLSLRAFSFSTESLNMINMICLG